MANVTLKKEERKTLYAQGSYQTGQSNSNDEDIFDFIQSLEDDETRLSEQKEHLTALLKQLQVKAKETVEKRKRNVEALNSEISDLKRRCEKLANWANIGSMTECSQTGL